MEDASTLLSQRERAREKERVRSFVVWKMNRMRHIVVDVGNITHTAGRWTLLVYMQEDNRCVRARNDPLAGIKEVSRSPCMHSNVVPYEFKSQEFLPSRLPILLYIQGDPWACHCRIPPPRAANR